MEHVAGADIFSETAPDGGQPPQSHTLSGATDAVTTAPLHPRTACSLRMKGRGPPPHPTTRVRMRKIPVVLCSDLLPVWLPGIRASPGSGLGSLQLCTKASASSSQVGGLACTFPPVSPPQALRPQRISPSLHLPNDWSLSLALGHSTQQCNLACRSWPGILMGGASKRCIPAERLAGKKKGPPHSTPAKTSL